MNEEDKRKVRNGILIALFTVLLYLGVQNLDVVLKIIVIVLKLLSPFLFGICFAFVLNIPMKFLEEKVFWRMGKKDGFWKKAKHPLCVTITVVLFLGAIVLLFSILIPQLVASVKSLADNIPGYLNKLQLWANNFLSQFGVSTDLNETISSYLTEFSDTILKYITNSVPQIMGTAVNITSGIISLFMGLIIGVYMLATKDGMIRNVKRTAYAFLPRKAADYLTHVYHITNSRFYGFVTGQLTEAFILATLCLVGMTLFRMPYALLISIIIGITNIVPIVGPIIGTIPGALIMLMVNPMQAVWFVVFIIILQQIESNFIYPKVVGSSVGLPGLWVMFAVLVGGNLFGLPGILLGVPTLSVIYVLLSEAVKKRLARRRLDPDRIEAG